MSRPSPLARSLAWASLLSSLASARPPPAASGASAAPPASASRASPPTPPGAGAPLPPASAGAPTPPAAPGASPAVDRAREAFVRGVALVKREQWAEALVEFDRSLAEHPHAVTHYNAALCHRALGRSVRATFALERALAAPSELPEATERDARALLDEQRARRSFLVIEVAAPGGALAIDGRPVERLGDVMTPTLGPGPASEVRAGSLVIALEPGEREVRLSREGHEPFASRLALTAGERRSLRVALRELPGELAIDSRPAGALLRIGGQPVGNLPLLLQRPAGPYPIEVSAPGRVPFQTEVLLRPGVRSSIMANLREERVSVLRRWWFWTGVGVVVAGAAVTTYALTRPTERADGGSLGWVVRP